MNDHSPKPHMGGEKIWLIGIVCVHIILALVYWHYTPYGAPPDEGPHGGYIRRIVEQHRLPVFDPADRANYEAHQPPLYYVLGVPFYLLGRAVHMYDPAEMVRLLSVILGALSILVIYRAVRTAFPDNSGLGVAAAGFAALLPTHVMLSSSVSNDILVELVFGLGLLVMTGMVLRGVTLTRSLMLGVVLGLGLLAKTTCLILFPVALLAYLISAKRATGIALVQFAIALATSLVIGGWWLLRNNHLYGDPLAASLFGQAFVHTTKPEYWLSRGFTPLTYAGLVLVWTFCSFWGVFGHMKVFMPAWSYVGLAVVSVVVKIGALGAILRQRDQRRGILVLYNVVLLLVVAAFIGFNVKFFQAQGRYLYPAILPISAFWALGIRGLLPESLREWTLFIAIAVPFVAQIIALATCIVPKMPGYQ